MSGNAKMTRMINRLTLQFFDDLNPVPMGFDEVEQHLENRLRERATHFTRDALSYLESAGYLKRCEATAADDALYKITATGTRMIKRMVPAAELDLMLFDGGAV